MMGFSCLFTLFKAGDHPRGPYPQAVEKREFYWLLCLWSSHLHRRREKPHRDLHQTTQKEKQCFLWNLRSVEFVSVLPSAQSECCFSSCWLQTLWTFLPSLSLAGNCDFQSHQNELGLEWTLSLFVKRRRSRSDDTNTTTATTLETHRHPSRQAGVKRLRPSHKKQTDECGRHEDFNLLYSACAGGLNFCVQNCLSPCQALTWWKEFYQYWKSMYTGKYD